MDKIQLFFLRRVVSICIGIDGRNIKEMRKLPREERGKYQKRIDKANLVETWASDWVAYYISRIYGEQSFGATNQLFERMVIQKNWVGILTYTQPIRFSYVIRHLISE